MILIVVFLCVDCFQFSLFFVKKLYFNYYQFQLNLFFSCFSFCFSLFPAIIIIFGFYIIIIIRFQSFK